MTVRELRHMLLQLDQDLVVYALDSRNGECNSVTSAFQTDRL
jgi:hypothetical protein